MLKIAVVANTYDESKRFVEHKFKDKISRALIHSGEYTLKNGDVIYLCYDEQLKSRYDSMEYDAFIIHPGYCSLSDTIRWRSAR